MATWAPRRRQDVAAPAPVPAVRRAVGQPVAVADPGRRAAVAGLVAAAVADPEQPEAVADPERPAAAGPQAIADPAPRAAVPAHRAHPAGRPVVRRRAVGGRADPAPPAARPASVRR